MTLWYGTASDARSSSYTQVAVSRKLPLDITQRDTGDLSGRLHGLATLTGSIRMTDNQFTGQHLDASVRMWPP